MYIYELADSRAAELSTTVTGVRLSEELFSNSGI